MKTFKALIQLFRYHRSIDVERALRWHYATGYANGKRDAMKHVPWPAEPHTDPLQQAAPGTLVLNLPPGEFTRAVRKQPGHNTDSRVLKVVGQVQLAHLQARMREKEGKD